MKKSLLVLAAALLAAGAAQADTLKKIKETGKVVMGVRESSSPLSFTVGSGKYVGYHVELCERIIGDIGKQLGINPTIEYTPVTSQNRIPLVQNGTVDIECGSTTNNLTRQRQVSYLQTTFITGTKIAVRKDSGVKEIEDLKGKVIGLASGTTNEKAIKDHIAENRLDIKITHVKDHSQGWLALETGRIDAYGSDDVLLYGLISKAKTPENYAVVGRYLSFDPYALMVPRNDATFQRLGTAVVSELMRSGEMEKLYNKWFAPGPTNINMPLSDTLRTAFQIQALPE